MGNIHNMTFETLPKLAKKIDNEEVDSNKASPLG